MPPKTGTAPRRKKAPLELPPLLLGAHMSTAGGPSKALERGLGLSPQLVSDWFAGRKTPTLDAGLQIQAFLKKQRRSRGSRA